MFRAAAAGGLAAQPNFFFELLSINFPCKTTKLEHFLFWKEEETEAEAGRIVKERIQVSHSTQGSRSMAQ